MNVGLARGLARPPEPRTGPDPRTLGRAGRRRSGLRARRAEPTRLDTLGDAWGFPCPDTQGRTTGRDDCPRRPPATSTLSGSSAATSSRPCPTKRCRDARSRAHACACTRTSCCRRRCSSTARATRCSCRPRTRYESPGGGTETSTERRIIFSPEIPGRRIGRPGPSGRCSATSCGARGRTGRQVGLDDAAAIRAGDCRRRAAVCRNRTAGAQGRPGAVGRPPSSMPTAALPPPMAKRALRGRRICAAATRRPDSFVGLDAPRQTVQFDGAAGRRPAHRRARATDILISSDDLARLGLEAGGPRAPALVASGRFTGHLRAAPIRAGNLEVHWPEGNALLSGLRFSIPTRWNPTTTPRSRSRADRPA